MITALVRYKKFIDPPHPLLDGHWEVKAKIVEVSKLTEINDMFKHIVDVKVIDKS